MENIEIVVGTYENLILGYKLIKQLKGDYDIELSFTDDSHRGALRCMSVSPSGTLVSSSTDDSIRLHSLTKRKDIGGLFEHTGTVNSISFYGNNHMFSASEDGTICIWRCRTWEMLRTLKGHKAHVTSMAAHPSGKLGLSVGSDKSFLTWDLVTGKLAFQRKLKEMAQDVLFTPKGDHYLLVYQRHIEVCLLEDTSTVKEIPTSWRINSVCFVDDEIIAIGGDNETVLIVNVLSGDTMFTLNCTKPEETKFTSRVRCVCTTKVGETTLVIAGMANGNLAVFKVAISEDGGESELMIFHEAKVRLTCMAIHNLTDVKAKENDQESELLNKALSRKKKRKPRGKDIEETQEDKTETAQQTLEDKTHQSANKNTSKKIKSQKLGKDKRRKLDDSDEQEKANEKETIQPEKGTKQTSRNVKQKRKLTKK